MSKIHSFSPCNNIVCSVKRYYFFLRTLSPKSKQWSRMVRTQKQGAIYVIMFSSVLLEIEIHFKSPLQILYVSGFDKQVSSA